MAVDPSTGHQFAQLPETSDEARAITGAVFNIDAGRDL